MAKTITKTKENHVVIKTTIILSDRIDTEEFDQERLDFEKVKAQNALTQVQVRIVELDNVQIEMNK